MAVAFFEVENFLKALIFIIGNCITSAVFPEKDCGAEFNYVLFVLLLFFCLDAKEPKDQDRILGECGAP